MELMSISEKVFDKKNAEKASIYSNQKQQDLTKLFQRQIEKNIKKLKSKQDLKALFDEFMKANVAGKNNILEKDYRTRFAQIMKEIKAF